MTTDKPKITYPTPLRNMLRLSQINIFPVKSLDGYTVEFATIEQRGLRYDRRWMLTDPHGMFLTLRNTPRMALLKAVIEAENLVVFEKNRPENRRQIPVEAKGIARTVQIWDDTCIGEQLDDALDAWLSEQLGKPCHLIKMPDTTRRKTDDRYNPTGEDMVSFADGYPMLTLGENALADLNQRLATPVSMRRFRANFIFSGGEAFEEDTWAYFKIGDVAFKGVKRCARCVLITRDPDTGERSKEPLQTLETYRKVNHKTYVGMNTVWDNSVWLKKMFPIVKVGDLITVEKLEE